MKALSVMRGWLVRGCGLLPKTLGGALIVVGSASCQAQEREAVENKTVEGKVQKMTTAPKGEIHGALLDDGSSLHWPPHLHDRFTKVVIPGERVRASGRTESGPAGDVHFEVETVTNTQSNISTTNPDYARRPQGPDGRNETTVVQGTVSRITTAPRGEVDGVLLEDGTWLHWPPHLQDTFSKLAKPGDKLSAKGRRESGPKGDERFEIKSIINLGTNATADNPDFERGPHGPGKKHHPHLAARPGLAGDERVETTEVSGSVKRMTKAPRGEVDGAVLDDGTWLHWPPHLQDQFTAVVKEDDKVRATVQKKTGPKGDIRFEVQSVTNTQSNRTAENPDLILTPSSTASRSEDANGRAQRLKDLERQIEQMQRELARLRLEK